VYRLNTARIEDPHMHLDKRVSLIVTVNLCGDITNDPEVNNVFLLGDVVIPALNPTFQELLDTDGDDADSFLDFSYVFDFDNLSQAANATGVVNAVESNCTSQTSCANAMGTSLAFDYLVRRTGNCNVPHRAFVDTQQWVGPTDRYSVVNDSVAGASGCFLTTNSEAGGNGRTFSLSITLQGADVVIPLRDAMFSGTFSGNPATGIQNGVLAGFLTFADADIDISVTDPVAVSLNLRDNVLPDGTSTNACSGSGSRPSQPDGFDDGNAPGLAQHPTLGSGWWFFVDYTSGEVTVSSGY
jgi:hypothetical protein